MHLIEGLAGGRFAAYTKVHHSLVDGFTGMKLLVNSLSTDPDERGRPLFFSVPAPKRPPREEVGDDDGGFLSDLETLTHELRRRARSGVTLATRIVDPLLRRGRYADLTGNLEAPRSILNGRIGRNRRFATQQYELAQLKQIGHERDATVNDVFLAIAGGGLRRYLGELGELPDKPLVAFLPVNVRAQDDVGGGNMVGAILATMATDIDDPVARLERVTASTRAAKAQLEGMTQEAILAYSSWLLAPLSIQAASAFTGIGSPLPLTFNLCVSNVPGPSRPLYLRGSRLEAAYPVSIPTHGMALNITVQSYAGTLCVGFVGCRDSVPHLQRLAVATGEELAELDRALSGTGANKRRRTPVR
jgi:WS/DGAT/MGAT family acyltransferase